MQAYRQIGKGSVQVSQPEAKMAFIFSLFVHPNDRGKGIAKLLLILICAEADKEGVTLFITPEPYGRLDEKTKKYLEPGLTYDQLCAFYRKFGFRRSGFTMKRGPKKEKRNG